MILASFLGAAKSTQIIPHGIDSSHEWAFGARKVQVIFHERTVGSEDAAYPLGIQDYAENKPVSIIHSLDILVDGHKIFVPPSAWSYLFDVNYAEVRLLKNGTFLLSIRGADGGYGYLIALNLNKISVTRKRSSFYPEEKVSEVTYYH
jgi:hypothetical protein